MRYALNESNNKIEPNYSGQRASCPSCKNEVTGKIYKNKKNHWAHLKKDCDNWFEPTSDWHLFWQNIFPKENQEVTLFDDIKGEFHRADIMLDNGLIIEIQNSPIVIKEVSEREVFYNRNGLIWIINARNIIPKAYFGNCFRADKCMVKLFFFTEYYYKFESEEIIEELKKKMDFLIYIQKKSTKEIIEYEFYCMNIGDTDCLKNTLEISINSLSWKYSRRNYENKVSFNIDINVVDEKYTLHKFLVKSQWRKFIDEMKSPVFLDNLTDLDNNYLFWVQKNKIVKKEDFIKKYLMYVKI